MEPEIESANMSVLIDNFIDSNAATDFICMICTDVANPNTATEHKSCGKIFCKDCIEKWIQSNRTCPDCKQGASGLSILKDHNKIVYRILSQLRLKCPTSPDETRCTWEGEFCALGSHISQCGQVYLPCPLGCGKKVRRKDQAKHETTDCPNVPTACVHCNRSMMRKDIVSHHAQCLDNPEAVLGCKYGYIGCEYKDKMKERREHEATRWKEHLELAVIHAKQLTERLKRNEGEGLKRSQAGKALQQAFENKFLASCHPHPLAYLVEDNGWACDGKNLPSRCFGGITGFRQTRGVPRYRCARCDFDLCDKCMAHYLTY